MHPNGHAWLKILFVTHSTSFLTIYNSFGQIKSDLTFFEKWSRFFEDEDKDACAASKGCTIGMKIMDPKIDRFSGMFSWCNNMYINSLCPILCL